jgi:hypothetical protein
MTRLMPWLLASLHAQHELRQVNAKEISENEPPYQRSMHKFEGAIWSMEVKDDT